LGQLDLFFTERPALFGFQRFDGWAFGIERADVAIFEFVFDPTQRQTLGPTNIGSSRIHSASAVFIEACTLANGMWIFGTQKFLKSTLDSLGLKLKDGEIVYAAFVTAQLALKPAAMDFFEYRAFAVNLIVNDLQLLVFRHENFRESVFGLFFVLIVVAFLGRLER